MVETDSLESQDSVSGTKETSRRRQLALAAAAGLVLAFVVGLGAAGVANTRSCASCHDRGGFEAATQASPHASVDCRRCHLSPGSLAQVVFASGSFAHAYTPGRVADREAADVPDSRCIECHQSTLEGPAVSNGIRMNHASCAENSACTDCHSSTGHGEATRWVRSYDMDGCLECHVALNQVGCNLCHEGKPVAARVKSIEFTATHGPEWKTTHGMGDTGTCSVCHVTQDCADCHGVGVPHEANFLDLHATYAGQPSAKCQSCHKTTFCDSCHGTQMPHPAGFTALHPTEARTRRAMCDRCHEKSDCTECHLKHVHPGGAIGTAVSGGGAPR